MKLRTGMLVGASALIAGIVAATVIAIAVVVDRSERDKLGDDLARSHRAFDDLISYRQSMLRSDCHVVANEPRMRATIGTGGVTHQTVLDVVQELRGSLGSDLFLVTDPDGFLLADALDASAEGFDLSKTPGIVEARTTGAGSSVWLAKDRAYQVEACRIELGGQPLGVAIVGRALDDAVATALDRQTGSTLVVTLDRVRIAGSSPTPEPADELAALVGRALTSSSTVEQKVAGVTFAATGGPLPGYTGKRELAFVLLRSLDDALAPGRRLIVTILGIAGIALVGALVLAFALSRRLSGPVDELVRFTQRVSKGELAARARAVGTTEVRELAVAMNHMIDELARSREALAAGERVHKEMEIAMRIQTSMLPRAFEVPGLQIAATMKPASEVGGDYYDVIPVPGGCWLGIGDVAGHGVTAGLEMLMVQSVVSALVRQQRGASPREHLTLLNRVIYDNVRSRLRQDEHMTLTLLHYAGGKVTFAGAHEEIIVLRAATGRCERVPTPGTWIGAIAEIGHVTTDSSLTLAKGDMMVLYTDGITEARAADGRQFGIDRLCELIEKLANAHVEDVRDGIMRDVESWQSVHEDDLSIVVVRREP